MEKDGSGLLNFQPVLYGTDSKNYPGSGAVLEQGNRIRMNARRKLFRYIKQINAAIPNDDDDEDAFADSDKAETTKQIQRREAFEKTVASLNTKSKLKKHETIEQRRQRQRAAKKVAKEISIIF